MPQHVTRQTVYRQDYQQPDFWVSAVSLTVQLATHHTIIDSVLSVTKNPVQTTRRLILNGDACLSLTRCLIDDQAIDIKSLFAHHQIVHGSYLIQKDHDNLIIEGLPDHSKITLQTCLNPAENTAFDGLYVSQDIFCTDCEPQGFRKITYFPDRPDNMAIYTVKIIAPKRYTQLLSNGNLQIAGEIDTETHYAIWHDPFPKPSYLFALVAGDLAYLEATHYRPDQTPVQLRIYAAATLINQCHFALSALRRAMQWDEKRFGLICDVDHYNIVAIADYNAGAMENKGLNIFNTKFILADPKTATDQDFHNVESVIGHEYFHNWTGNRVTCRDWFQLSLKEGLTVFRDQEFSSDLHHRGLQRIRDVTILRTHQFPEDAGALAHPIRPDSYIEMRNFYTATVYEKGAEVVRLYQTLLGKAGFEKGLQLYLQRFDGQAATCDDFLNCMREANHAALPYFERWYSQAGTPSVTVTTEYDAIARTYCIHFHQFYAIPAQQHYQPLLIPIVLGLIAPNGDQTHQDCVVLTQAKHTIIYEHVNECPVPSLLREFSAPVRLHYGYSHEELIHLVQYDQDDFSRFEAMQRLHVQLCIDALSQKTPTTLVQSQQHAYQQLLIKISQDSTLTPDFLAALLTFPTLHSLIDAVVSEYAIVDPYVIHTLRQQIIQTISIALNEVLLSQYQTHQADHHSQRALKNSSLTYLAYQSQHHDLIIQQYENAVNMTDRFAALKCAVDQGIAAQSRLCADFKQTYQDYPLVIDQWFNVQAAAPSITIDALNALTQHADFNYLNPNRMRALLGAVGQNSAFLHRDPDQHFRWLASEVIKVDQVNPQIAARLATPFTRWQNFQPSTINAIQYALGMMLKTSHCSTNLAEVLNKSLITPSSV